MEKIDTDTYVPSKILTFPLTFLKQFWVYLTIFLNQFGKLLIERDESSEDFKDISIAVVSLK